MLPATQRGAFERERANVRVCADRRRHDDAVKAIEHLRFQKLRTSQPLGEFGDVDNCHWTTCHGVAGTVGCPCLDDLRSKKGT